MSSSLLVLYFLQELSHRSLRQWAQQTPQLAFQAQFWRKNPHRESGDILWNCRILEVELPIAIIHVVDFVAIIVE